mmetsp:Transcript_13127/g.15656  ORF Transcript_13127/g.15656 Transcript_13127/m.15656 type:complete len:260 (+) Transcript_13127:103-882(+)
MLSKYNNKKRHLKKSSVKAEYLPLHIEKVKWDARLQDRFEDLMSTTRYNLNGAYDNAIAEALALAVVYKNGQVLAERDLVRCSGVDMIAGTPDGAVLLSSGGMIATQVVRIGNPKGHGGVKEILKKLLIKVFKSLCWLMNSGLGHTVSSFIIAAWIPKNLSRKAASALNRLLKTKLGIDGRFELVLLVPPSADMRQQIFPKSFGHREDAEEKPIIKGANLMNTICSYSALCAYSDQCQSVNNDGEVDLGFLADLFLADC